MTKKRLFIIDAMALAFRSFYAFGSRQLTTDTGKPTSMIFGSAMFLHKLHEKEQPDYLVCVSDCREPTFRHKMYAEYKANRSAMPEELAAQLPDFFKLFDNLNCPILKKPGFEADDIIATIAKNNGGADIESYIVSGDKDFMQLINAHTFLYIPKKASDPIIVDATGVKQKFGCKPEQVIDILAIIGDTADNVPGVKGIGEKGAAKLIQAYHSLDNIYANIDEISAVRQQTALKNSKESAYLSQKLVTIDTDVAIDFNIKDALCSENQFRNNPKLAQFYQDLQFRNLVNKVQATTMPATNVSTRQPSLTTKLTNSETPANTNKASTKTHENSQHKYTLVNTMPALLNLLKELNNCKLFSFDTETTGLDIINHKAIGISLSYKEDEAFYIPVINKDLIDVDESKIREKLTIFFDQSNAIKVGHNLKFDIQMLNNVNIYPTGPFVDTMIMDTLIDSNQRHSLDECCLRYLNYTKIVTPLKVKKKDAGYDSMLEVPIKELNIYACEDADYTLKLYKKIFPILKENNLETISQHIEMPLVPIMAKMEQNGFTIDQPFLENYEKVLTAQLSELEQEIFQICATEFNIRSPQQVGNVLFETLKIQEQFPKAKVRKSKTGYVTDEKNLLQFKEHRVVSLLLQFREATKLKSTYVDALLKLVDKTTRRVHGSFMQIGAATGRLSSSKPNLQNIPIRTPQGKEIRKAFIAENSDFCLISADYSQVELRILAHISKDENLITAFKNDADIHKETAARIFCVPMSEVSPVMRSRAKAINFGIIYGMGPRRLATETKTTLKEAKDFIARYFEQYQNIKLFIDTSLDYARKNLEVLTIAGRKRKVKNINDKNPLIRNMAENIAINTPIQGSAADLVKLAMINVNNDLQDKQLEAKLLLQVHDELIFECKKVNVKAVSDCIKFAMENAMQLSVPLKVDINNASNWLEAH